MAPELKIDTVFGQPVQLSSVAIDTLKAASLKPRAVVQTFPLNGNRPQRTLTCAYVGEKFDLSRLIKMQF